MHLLIVSLCAVTTIMIVLDAAPCTMEKQRDTIRDICAGRYHYRRKRGNAYDDYSFSEKGTGKYSTNQNDFRSNGNHPTRHEHVHVIANDTSGGILIRHKRGSEKHYMYCCLDLGNCTFIC